MQPVKIIVYHVHRIMQFYKTVKYKLTYYLEISNLL